MSRFTILGVLALLLAGIAGCPTTPSTSGLGDSLSGDSNGSLQTDGAVIATFTQQTLANEIDVGTAPPAAADLVTHSSQYVPYQPPNLPTVDDTTGGSSITLPYLPPPMPPLPDPGDQPLVALGAFTGQTTGTRVERTTWDNTPHVGEYSDSRAMRLAFAANGAPVEVRVIGFLSTDGYDAPVLAVGESITFNGKSSITPFDSTVVLTGRELSNNGGTLRIVFDMTIDAVNGAVWAGTGRFTCVVSGGPSSLSVQTLTVYDVLATIPDPPYDFLLEQDISLSGTLTGP